VSVKLGHLASQALDGTSGGTDTRHVSSRASEAIRCYLGDKDGAGPGWSYPSFLDRRRSGEEVEFSLDIDDELWGSLEAEAGHQDVSVELLLEHAVLYFAAEVDAGRIAERILEDLDEG